MTQYKKLTYEPPGYKKPTIKKPKIQKNNDPSWFERNKPEFVTDYQELSPKCKVLFIILSILLIGGGTCGCLYSAGAFNFLGEFIKNKPSTTKTPISKKGK